MKNQSSDINQSACLPNRIDTDESPQAADTGQLQLQQQQQQKSNKETKIMEQRENNDFNNNCTNYSVSLNNRLLLDNDLEDIDSTDDLDDIDDLDSADAKNRNSSQSGDNYMNSLADCSNLTGLANNAAMFIEDDKRKRRAIANSNERRRMQSINAGFQTLKSLIPHSSGEKLSKACILQRSADFMQFLSNEKDKLSNKLHAALKLIESNGLLSQFQNDQAASISQAQAANSLNFSSASKSSTTKINKQYVSSYNAPGTTGGGTAASSLLSSALTDCTNDPKTTNNTNEDSALSIAKIHILEKNPQKVNKQHNSPNTTTPIQAGPTMPIKNISSTFNRTVLQTNSPLELELLDNKNNTSSKLITPILATPIISTQNAVNTNLRPTTIIADPIPVTLLNPQSISGLISANNYSNQINSTQLTDTIINQAPGLLIPNTNTELVATNIQLDVNVANVKNVTCFQMEMNNSNLNPTQSLIQSKKSEIVQEHKSGEESPIALHTPNQNVKINAKITSHDLVNLLNDIKNQNPTIDINSAANLILKSVLSSNVTLNNDFESQLRAEPNSTEYGSLIKSDSIENRLKIETNFEKEKLQGENVQKQHQQSSPGSNILLISTKTSQEKSYSITKINNLLADNNSNQGLTNNHLKNAIGKSSRSNSIDQLIAAAAVTAHSSTCMSPLSPSNSPTGLHRTSESSSTTDDSSSNELTVSRKNLNTIVEAIFHVEGASRLDELVDPTELSKQNKYQNSLPSSSYTASSSSSLVYKDQEQVQQQQKPPKKRKYTTEDITQTQEDAPTPNKLSNQFISEYYNNTKSEQCQSINKILAQSDLAKNPSSKDIVRGAEYDSIENESKKKQSTNLLGLIV